MIRGILRTAFIIATTMLWGVAALVAVKSCTGPRAIYSAEEFPLERKAPSSLGEAAISGVTSPPRPSTGLGAPGRPLELEGGNRTHSGNWIEGGAADEPCYQHSPAETSVSHVDCGEAEALTAAEVLDQMRREGADSVAIERVERWMEDLEHGN